MRRLPHGMRCEFPPPLVAHGLEGSILQKPGLIQRLRQLRFDLTHLQVARHLHQRRAQIEWSMRAVEAIQAFDEPRRNHQHRIRIAVGIANEEAWMLRRRRRHEIEIHAQTRQVFGQVPIVAQHPPPLKTEPRLRGSPHCPAAGHQTG